MNYLIILTLTLTAAFCENSEPNTQQKVKKHEKRGIYGLGSYGSLGGYEIGSALAATSGLSLAGPGILASPPLIGAPLLAGGGYAPGILSADTHTLITKRVGVPYPVPVDRPVAVPYPVERKIIVDRPVAVPVIKHVPAPYPVAVPKPYPVHITKHVAVPYAKPYPVPVPYKQVIISKPEIYEEEYSSHGSYGSHGSHGSYGPWDD